MAVLGLIPFILALSICPLMAINHHNHNIDQEIYELVFHANLAMRSRSGCSIEYARDFVGLCIPQGVRPWRALIIHGDPGQQARGFTLQPPPSEMAPLTVPLAPGTAV